MGSIFFLSPSLVNTYVMLEGDQKLSALSHFIVENKDKKIIVYFLTGAMVDYFWKVFKRTRSPS